MVQFISNVQYFGDGADMPHIITVRPIITGTRNGNLGVIFNELAPTIIDRVVVAVRNYNSTWSRDRIIREVHGRLVANNEIDGNTTGYTASFTTLDAITPEALDEVFTQIQQSNADILITDIEWSFLIAPDSIMIGGSGKVKPPSWAPAVKYRNTWLGWKVNCAAYALNYLMYSTEKRYDNCVTRSIEDAKALQEEMGWGEFTTPRELEKFVEIYDEYRVSIVLPFALRTPHEFVFVGKKWNPDITDTSKCPEKTLYLVYDAEQKHYAATKSPAGLISRIKGHAGYVWCHRCNLGYLRETGHTCPDQPPAKKKIRKTYPCKKCGVLPVAGKTHTCPLVTCKMCSAIYKRETGFNHRCIVFKEPRKDEKNTFCSDKTKTDGSLFSLWVYDFESRIDIEEVNRELIVGFETEGVHYKDENVCIFDKKVQKHEVNFVAFRNVFTDEEHCYYGDGALQEFVLFMLAYNTGKNICIAHNASGYDTRLLFSKLKSMNQKVSMAPIMRGGKFMQLAVNKNLIFRDSLLHVKGSLKSLAKDFCDGLLEKGYFPHLFNSTENYGYIGPIPDKKFFDLSFSVRSEKEMKDFDSWYATWLGRDDWNFDEELSKYCRNDVHVLQKIVKGYHDVAFAKFGMSPWFNATAPSFVHEVFLVKLGQQLELPDKTENMEEYKEKLKELAWDEYWAVLQPNEYWFARKALRGGRTEIRKRLHVVKEEDWNRGVRIRYQDICSQYPFQQVVHDFPVGLPLIHIWDKKYFPCIADQNNPEAICSCNGATPDRFCRWKHEKNQWTCEEILKRKDFFGIVCASLDPPKNMYHPVLVVFDEKLGKSIATCQPIVEGVFTSIEFVVALKNGYTLKKMHRYDQYNRKPSLWRDIVLDLFLEKMINSKEAPTGEKAKKLIEDYGDLFGDDFAEKIEESIRDGLWGKNPAKKQTAKIMMNSAWGKHAQRPIMPEVAIWNCKDDVDDIFNFFENCTTRNYEFHSGTFLNGNDVMYKYSVSGKDTRPDLHGGYLPAALFVPAYGRLQLWEQLNMLGKRVLMNDTDSIVYVYDPELDNIPEGSLLGQWEVEDEDRDNGGIREFVGLGPKTYGFKCDNGYSKVKAKGLSLNLATEKRINFETMKKLAISNLNGRKERIAVPQKTFVWSVEKGMRTWMMMKDLRVDIEGMKGTMDEEGYIYPLGFEK